MNSFNQMHHFVVVGGGAGGLELATKLGNKLGKKQKARITLVDAALTHVWKPLLHEVAAGSLNSDAAQVDFRVHAQQHYFEYQPGRLTGLNRADKTITLAAIKNLKGDEVVAERHLSYDTLVLAVGSTTNDFGTKGAAEFCQFLDSQEQARLFHRNLLNRYLKAEYAEPEKRNLRVAIIGAGATGVELAAELRYASQQLEYYGLHNVGAGNISISLIEAGDRILPALKERLSSAACRELKKLDIDVLTSKPVTEITEQGLLFADGSSLDAEVKVWAAGIKAPAFLAGLDGLETNRLNQLKVHATLQTTLDANIYAFGDCAECWLEGSERPVPPRAQAAHQQASTLYKTLLAKLEGKPAHEFIYRDHGSLVSLSDYTAVGSLMGNLSKGSMMVEGKLARLFYVSLYRMHQIALHGFFKTGLIWLNDRLMKAIHSRLKLH